MVREDTTDAITETAPLLEPDSSDEDDRKSFTRQDPFTAWLIIATVFFVSVGGVLMQFSMLRITESVICYLRWEATDPSYLLLGRDKVGPGAIGGVEERYCKTNGIQVDLAKLLGLQQFLDAMPGLIVAIPIGYLADRYGRRPFLMATLIGFALNMIWNLMIVWFWQTFDVHLILVSAVFSFSGSTSGIAMALLFAVMTDITDTRTRIVMFLRVGAVNYVGMLLAPVLAAWLMSINPWIAAFTGLALMLCACILYIGFAPETRDMSDRKVLSSDDETSDRQAPAFANGDSPWHKYESGIMTALHTVAAVIVNGLAQTLRSIRDFVVMDWRVTVMILLFLGHSFIGASTPLLVQYCSKHFDLTQARATLLAAVLTGVKALQCGIFLPIISTWVTSNTKLNGTFRDMVLARTSFILLATGWIVISLSNSIPMISVGMVIAALGQGAFYLVRVVLTAIAPKEYVGRIFSIVSIFDTAGLMLGGPVLSTLFAYGLDSGNNLPAGLPWLFIGILVIIFTITMCTIKVR